MKLNIGELDVGLLVGGWSFVASCLTIVNVNFGVTGNEVADGKVLQERADLEWYEYDTWLCAKYNLPKNYGGTDKDCKDTCKKLANLYPDFIEPESGECIVPKTKYHYQCHCMMKVDISVRNPNGHTEDDRKPVSEAQKQAVLSYRKKYDEMQTELEQEKARKAREDTEGTSLLKKAEAEEADLKLRTAAHAEEQAKFKQEKAAFEDEKDKHAGNVALFTTHSENLEAELQQKQEAQNRERAQVQALLHSHPAPCTCDGNQEPQKKIIFQGFMKNTRTKATKKLEKLGLRKA